MSLSGNLGFVSLDEVLRLLTRSGQRGSVAVRGQGVEGRVFVTRGGITLATIDDDQGLQTLLLKSGLVEPHELADGVGLERDDQELIDLLREITVESIYRLNLHGDTFDVTEGAEARFASPEPFELEQLLEDSRKRLEDWAEVSQIISDLSSRIRFQRDLGGREEVTIKRDAWRVLSEVGSGASVTQIATELGTTEFWAARIVARLIENHLLDTEGEAKPTPASDEPWAMPVTSEMQAEEPYSEPEPDTAYAFGEPEQASRPEDEAAEAVDETEDEPAEVPAVSGQPQAGDDDFDPNQSWWQEPARESADNEADDGSEVEEDTEAFLEKVFSELDTDEESEDEGYGLLRRRRLGAMRDIARDT